VFGKRSRAFETLPEDRRARTLGEETIAILRGLKARSRRTTASSTAGNALTSAAELSARYINRPPPRPTDVDRL